MTSLKSGVKLGLMNKIKIYLVTAYSIVLLLIIVFPPWSNSFTPYGKNVVIKSFSGFRFILNGAGQNIHTTFLFFEILIVTLIFGAIFYLNKDKMK